MPTPSGPIPALIASVREAEAKMTPGPWETEPCNHGPGSLAAMTIPLKGYPVAHHYTTNGAADSAGTALFRSVIIPLCDEIERLQRENSELRGAMMAQDNRERAAGEKCGVPYEQGGADWPDEVAEEVLRLRARLAGGGVTSEPSG